ncbi:hypothetical protein IAG25_25465 [Caballeronia sp. EK]|uniref:DNA-primase RepB domain-containing protein n=1 Tax=Caballeronia sp. EK TaxID=2767469 RepID=UPI001655CF86|nr:DNA-primase RepB domain-containing protein [Caballeronia sp. EK]MBC8640184.1 hypothetical protein [Caballeronia sp. EK]
MQTLESKEENTVQITAKERMALAQEFLNELGAGLPDDERVMVTYPEKANNIEGEEYDGRQWASKPYREGHELPTEKNCYAMISSAIKAKHPKTGEMKFWRHKSNFGHGLALMVDDIGTGAGSKGDMTLDDLKGKLEPTVIIETSPSNFQAWYFFDEPVADRERYAAFLEGFASEALSKGGDHTIKDITRIGRFGMGVNNKRREDGSLKYSDASGKPFQPRQVEANYFNRYTMEEIAAAFEFDIVVREKYVDPDCAADDFNAAVFKSAVRLFGSLGSGTGPNGAMEERTAGKYRIVCPWGDEHSTGQRATDAAFWNPDARHDVAYNFHCSHDSCQKAGRKWKKFIDQIVMPDIENKLEAANDDCEAVEGAMTFNEEARGYAFSRPITAFIDKIGPEPFVRGAQAASGRASRAQDADEKETQDESRKNGPPEGEGTGAAAAGDNTSGGAAAAANRAQSNSTAAKGVEDLGVGSKWYYGWWYSLAESAVCRPGSKHTYKSTDFNAVFGSDFFNMKAEKKLGKKSAFTWVQDVHPFKPAAGTAHVFGRPATFEFEGSVYVNTFNEKTIPPTATEYTDEGVAAILTVRTHIRQLTGEKGYLSGDWEADKVACYLESWIAMNVKQPGKTIGFCPLIKGIQGDGKTIIFQGLMAALLGDANVSTVNGDQITKKSGWAKGSAMVCIEEVKPESGEIRSAVTDKLKTYVTNPKVEIEDKWVKRHIVPNGTNYAALTNYENAIPLDLTDRRYMVVFTPWRTIAQFVEVNGQYEKYFERLASSFDHAAQLRKFFNEYELAAGFKWNMRAPDTESKKVMINAEEADMGMSKIKAYIEHGELGVSKDIIAARLLQEHIQRDTGEVNRMRRQIATMLGTKLGWTRAPEDVRWEGGTYTVYVRNQEYLKHELLSGEAIDAEKAKDPAFMKKFVNARLRSMLDATATEENCKRYVPASKDSTTMEWRSEMIEKAKGNGF